MERYTVAIGTPGAQNTTLLVVPYPASATISSLIPEIIERAARRGLQLSDDAQNATLRLAGFQGPFLDRGDSLSTVVLDPKTEHIYAHFDVMQPNPNLVSQNTVSEGI